MKLIFHTNFLAREFYARENRGPSTILFFIESYRLMLSCLNLIYLHLFISQHQIKSSTVSYILLFFSLSRLFQFNLIIYRIEMYIS